MLSDKEIRALMDGAYGITRNGVQVKYMGKTKSCKYGWAKYRDGYLDDIEFNYIDFCSYWGSEESPLDIIGLWEDKPESFDLERALAGEPLIDLHNNEKLWLYKSHKDGSLITEYENTHDHLENVNPLEYLGDVKDLSQCFGMWKEPEPISSADDLPKPIREFGYLEVVWYVNKTKDRYAPYGVTKNGDWLSTQYTSLSRGCYYATEEDCKRICEWLMNR